MTKAEIVETVLLQLSGGRLSNDVDVRREDIFVLIDAAINEVMRDYSHSKLTEQRARLRMYGAPGLDQAVEFAVTHKLTPILDEDRNLYYLDVPGKIYRSGGRSGLSAVLPMQGKAVYKDAQSEAYVRGLPDMGMVFYWLEIVDDKDRVYIMNMSTPVCQHLLTYSIKPDEAAPDDELGMPEGLDLEVVRRLVEVWKPKHPADVELTDTDETRMVK